MPTDRLPLRPPPRALHMVACPADAHRAGAPFAVRCASRGRRLHGTLNRAMVTCPRCRALLAAETTPTAASGGPYG
jgi:uncharacterized protein YbaR (Trm112 family)